MTLSVDLQPYLQAGAFTRPQVHILEAIIDYFAGLTDAAYAPIASSFITVAADTTLTAERSIAFGSGFAAATDGGANSTYTINLDATLIALAAYNTNGIMTQTAADTFAGRTLQAPAAGLTIANPAGIVGDPTFALANDLAALEALASTGFAARTTTDTWAQRTLTAPAAGFSITNPAGVAGDPTFVLADDLAALEALASNGIAARTGTSTWAVRTITAPAAGITISDGDGVAGNPTLSLANDLAALEALASTGFAARTASDTWAQRSLTEPASGLTIANPAGIAGNPTFALANDLAAIEALASTGIAVRSGSDTWVQRTLTAPAAGLTITNSDGVSGNPTFALADDLSGIEGLSSNGLAARTGTSTWATRTLTGPAAGISVANGDGVSGNPTLSLVNDLSAVEGLSGTGIARRTASDTWSVGTTVSVAEGGTGITSYTVGDIIYASGATTLAALADVATGNVLRSGGIGVAPAWGKVNLTTDITGDLPFANLTQGSALSVLGVTGNATADVASIAAGSDYQVLRRSGTSVAFGAIDVSQSAAVTGIMGSANGGTGNGFTKFSGPATSEKTFTLPNSSSTLHYEGGTIGATTPSTGAFTTLTTTGAATIGDSSTLEKDSGSGLVSLRVKNLSSTVDATTAYGILFTDVGADRWRLAAYRDGTGEIRLHDIGSAVNVQTWSSTGTTVAGTISSTVYTVATLPAGVSGRHAFVSDALAPAFGAAVAAGGAVPVPVYHDGTNWKVG